MKQRYTFGTPQFSLKEDLLKKAYLKTCNHYGLEEIPFHLNCHLQIPSAIGLGSSAKPILTGVILARIVHKMSLHLIRYFSDNLHTKELER